MANARLKRFHDEDRVAVYPFEPLIGVAFGLAVDELEHECEPPQLLGDAQPQGQQFPTLSTVPLWRD
jgi:hypothetical protein